MAYLSWGLSVVVISPVDAQEMTRCPDMEVVISHLLWRTATERIAESWRWVWV